MDMSIAQTKLRILLLEDVPVDAELIENALHEAGLSFTSKRVDTREAFIWALEKFKPDIVLADYSLPAFDGGSALKIVRQQFPAIPVLMVTGAMGDEKAIELLKLGAKDYIIKDRLARLGPAVRRAISEEEGIRARKAAEKALRGSEARYRRITEGLTDYQYTVHIENGCAVKTTQSPACVMVTGYQAEEFSANPYLWIEMVAPEDRDLVMGHAKQIMAGNEVPPIEHRIVRKDGVSRWVSDTTILFKDASGNLLSYDGVIKDITERKNAEVSLRNSKNQLQTILENLSEGVAVSGLDGQLLHFNRAALDLHGFTALDECLQHLTRFADMFELSAMDGTVWPVDQWPLARILRGENLHDLEARVRHIQAGWRRIFNYGGTLVHDANDQPMMAVITISDITGRKQAEIRIQKWARLYATLSQTNQIIVRTTTRAELFGCICEKAVTYGKFIMAWVGLVDEVTHMVKPVCHYGAEQGYLTNIAISIDDVPAGHGLTGTAIRENRVSYMNDFATDERALPWREATLKRGFRGGAGLPLRFQGKVIGALTLYVDEPDFFDADQLDLLGEMAADISFALEGFEREALHQRAEAEREAALVKLREALEDSIQMAASIGEMRDPYTAGHQQRVSKLAVAIARELGFSAAQVEGIRFGSLIHDIGKIGVPAEILSKPSRLTPLEMQLIQTHSKAGYEIIKDIELPWPVAQMILQHHERLDGSGYPAGLKGDSIFPEAKIIAVADTVEAMSSHRPYRPGLGMDAALAEIAGASGTLYDKQTVEACIRLIREKGFTFKQS